MEFAIHPKTKQRLKGLSEPGVYLVHGPKGVGKTTSVYEHEDGDRIYRVEPEKGTIKLEAMHEVLRHLRLKQTQRLTIIIDDADSMSLYAQNALLKTLEELPSNVTFIMVAHNVNSLLPTIRSRARNIYHQPPSREQTTQWLAKQAPDLSKTDREDLLKHHGLLPARILRHLHPSHSETDNPFQEKKRHIEALLLGDFPDRLWASQQLQAELPEVLDEISVRIREELRREPNNFWADMSRICLLAQQLYLANVSKRYILDVIALRGMR